MWTAGVLCCVVLSWGLRATENEVGGVGGSRWARPLGLPCLVPSCWIRLLTAVERSSNSGILRPE